MTVRLERGVLHRALLPGISLAHAFSPRSIWAVTVLVGARGSFGKAISACLDSDRARQSDKRPRILGEAGRASTRFDPVDNHRFADAQKLFHSRYPSAANLKSRGASMR